MEEKKMRVTAHNGRAGKDGVYSAKHNDRNFDMDKADHIDPSRAGGNWYWHCYQQHHPEMTFDEAERNFYEKNFSEMLNDRNKNYIDRGHREHVWTVDDYRKHKRSCPEEIIMQIGKVGQTVDPALLQKICVEHINWKIKRYPQVKILDVALHVDEKGGPHMHERDVWVGHNKKGQLCVGQTKALQEMGIERPQPDKPVSRGNNAKMTYTRECREHLLEVCRKHGLEIEENPKEASKSGLSLLEYQRQQEQEKLQALEKENGRLRVEASQIKEEMQKAKKEASQAKKEASQAKEEAHQAKVEAAEAKCQAEESWEEIRQLKVSSEKFQENIKQAQERLQGLEDKNQELDEINAQIEVARRQFRETLDQKARASEIHKAFGDRETQVYHKNMLESTRKIGSEAYNRLREAQSMEQGVVARETALKRKEQRVEEMYEEAEQTLKNARKKQKDMDTYISRSAAIVANKIIQQMQPMTDREWQMREFMSQYEIDGKTLYQIYWEAEQRQAEAEKQDLEQKAQQETREYLRDEWGLEDPRL